MEFKVKKMGAGNHARHHGKALKDEGGER
jgi:hypothetical protein